MTYPWRPPETNSADMFSGAGTATIRTAVIAWTELAEQLNTAAEEFSSQTLGLTDQPWQGSAAAMMVAKAEAYTERLRTNAARAVRTATQANLMADAFETARATAVPPEVVAANRKELEQLARTNILDQNTAAIAANEGKYAEIWARDVAAIADYHRRITTATQQIEPWGEEDKTTQDEDRVAMSEIDDEEMWAADQDEEWWSGGLTLGTQNDVAAVADSDVTEPVFEAHHGDVVEALLEAALWPRVSRGRA